MSDLNYTDVLGRAGSVPPGSTNLTRKIYDSLASVYQASSFLFHSKAHACLLRSSNIRDGMRVLEVATGSGEIFRQLVRCNPHGQNIGLDLSPNMARLTLRRARKACPEGKAHCGAVDVRHLPFPSASFDAVICCYLLELLPRDDIRPTLREIRRVLCPGGTFSLVLVAQNGALFNRAYRLAGRLVPAFWGRQVETVAAEMIRKAGMRVVADQFVRQGFYPSRVLVASNATDSRGSGRLVK